ncbi:ATP-binding cassette domain-containing protein [Oceanobacillus kapialis]|uniref:ATP-binding cassette domain-containing protein n=1 Tax=Oceanobacillus kapialis TaxID=481353 RepID=UPI00384B7C86
MKDVKTNYHIETKQLQKDYPGRNVLSGINLSIRQGEFIAIVGKSGCGKSTLLRLLAGLEKPSDGKLLMGQTPLTELNDQARMMFQDGRLLPWKKVIDNVSLGLPKEGKHKAKKALQLVGLEDRMTDWPAMLSGGQKQRVALARALVHEPSLLLLDEPLGALDALTRLEMQGLIEELWQQKRFTAILVTHDVEEAVAIADRVIVIENGNISLNQAIDLPRPRQRTSTAFSMYLDQILDKIMGRKPNKKITLLHSYPNKTKV